MPEKRTIERARKAQREGKSPSTQAGEFVREEIEIVRQAGMACAIPSRLSPSASQKRGGRV